MTKEFNFHYSGPLSRKIWHAINLNSNYCKDVDLYMLGCLLQDVESRLLQFLRMAIKRRNKAITDKKKRRINDRKRSQRSGK